MRALTLVAAGLCVVIAGCSATPVSAPTSASVPATTVAPAPSAAPLQLTSLPAYTPAASDGVACAGEGVSVFATESGGRVNPMIVAGPVDAAAALVFAHQSDGDECQWLGQARRFAERGYRVYLPRAGGNDGPSLLAAAVATARTAGAKKVGMVGASMGGTYALGTASALDPEPDAVAAISAPDDFAKVDAAGLIGRIKAPVLLAVGAKDNDFASDQSRLAAAAPAAQAVVQPDTAAHG